MAKKQTTTISEPQAPKAPKTVNTLVFLKMVLLSTIIWSVSVIVALGLGFYLGITAKTAYAESVKSEAKTLVSELKLSQ